MKSKITVSLALILVTITGVVALGDEPTLSTAGITKVYSCIERLQNSNYRTFPGNGMYPSSSFFAFPQDLTAENAQDVIFVSKTNVACASTPSDQGISPGQTLLKINPRDFGVEAQPYLTTLNFRKASDETYSVGDGGPYSGVITPLHEADFKIFEVKPKPCLNDAKVGQALYRWLKTAILHETVVVNDEAKSASKEEIGEERQKIVAALDSCKNIGNRALDALINEETANLNRGSIATPATSITR